MAEKALEVCIGRLKTAENLHSPETFTDAEWSDRVKHFFLVGQWSRLWGPAPGEERLPGASTVAEESGGAQWGAKVTADLVLYTLDEVATIFRVSPRTMKAYVRQHPFYRVLGGRKLFTRADIRALYEALQCPSSSSDGQDGRTGTSMERSEASLYARAQELLTERPRKRSGRGGSGKSSSVVSLAERRQLHSSGQP